MQPVGSIRPIGPIVEPEIQLNRLRKAVENIAAGKYPYKCIDAFSKITPANQQQYCFNGALMEEADVSWRTMADNPVQNLTDYYGLSASMQDKLMFVNNHSLESLEQIAKRFIREYFN